MHWTGLDGRPCLPCELRRWRTTVQTAVCVCVCVCGVCVCVCVVCVCVCVCIVCVCVCVCVACSCMMECQLQCMSTLHGLISCCT